MKKPKFTFTIIRSRWWRGRGQENSALLKPKTVNRKQCCIGQVCSQIGLPDKMLAEQMGINDLPCSIQNDLPKSVWEKFKRVFDAKCVFDYISHNSWVRQAYVVNDNPRITDAERETQLTELCAANGISLKFVE